MVADPKVNTISKGLIRIQLCNAIGWIVLKLIELDCLRSQLENINPSQLKKKGTFY